MSRGPVGSVAGVPPRIATPLLVSLVEKLTAKGSRRYHRSHARRLLQEQWKLDGAALRAFLQALDRIPGNTRLNGGWWLLPPKATAWAEQRQWRVAVGQLNLHEATALLRCLRTERFNLPPKLETLYTRLWWAIEATGVEEG